MTTTDEVRSAMGFRRMRVAGEPRKRQVKMRLTDAEMARVAGVAHRLGMDVGEWARAQILKAAP